MIPKNDTAWIKTQFANLYKAPSGVYWMRAKIKGRLIRKSLKTRSFEIAQKLLKTRHEHETKNMAVTGSQSFAALADEWLVIDGQNQETTASTKKVHRMTVEFLYRTWPELKNMNVSKVANCEPWSARVKAKYSAARHNSAVMALRSVLNLGIKRDLILDNAAKDLKQATVYPKDASLPSSAKFAAMLAWLDQSPRTQPAGILVRVLAYTGMRAGEAKWLDPSMVDLEANEIRLPGEVMRDGKKVRMTKNGEPRPIPIISELKPLLEKLLAEWNLRDDKGRFIPVYDIRSALRSSCKAAGTPRITHHDLRKLFTTRCIESRVDIRTVAQWLGHQDGGALLLKTYAHLRNEHSQNMAKLVKFS